MMAATDGWRVEKAEAVKTTAAPRAGRCKAPVAGFKPISCYKRPRPARRARGHDAVDLLGRAGLGFAVRRALRRAAPRRRKALFASGATHTLTRRIQDWWLTAVGEVPPQTLKAFAQSLERRS